MLVRVRLPGTCIPIPMSTDPPRMTFALDLRLATGEGLVKPAAGFGDLIEGLLDLRVLRERDEIDIWADDLSPRAQVRVDDKLRARLRPPSTT